VATAPHVELEVVGSDCTRCIYPIRCCYGATAAGRVLQWLHNTITGFSFQVSHHVCRKSRFHSARPWSVWHLRGPPRHLRPRVSRCFSEQLLRPGHGDNTVTVPCPCLFARSREVVLAIGSRTIGLLYNAARCAGLSSRQNLPRSLLAIA
jgi:hypothetical protein